MKKSKKSNLSFKKDYSKLSIAAHKKMGGKLTTLSKFKLKNKDDLSVAYTPGVAAVCLEIKKDPLTASELTLKKNTVAVLSDGSAVLGLGNIGALASIPVMEGKSVILKNFANVDGFPICVNTQNVEEIIQFAKQLEPVFGGINLEDIAAPKCFEIEERLREELKIPVMHDDQWGAAVVTLSGLINSLKVVNKKFDELKIVVAGVGAAGIASIRLIKSYAPESKIYALDSKGVISYTRARLNDLNNQKKILLDEKVLEGDLDGDISQAVVGADVFIGLSQPNILTVEMVDRMNSKPIVFGLANPTPEISFEESKKTKIAVFATGRSDYPNQINNSLFFPGFWRGMLNKLNSGKGKEYTMKTLHKTAMTIAKMVKPMKDKILPSTLDKKVHTAVAKVVESS